MLPDGAELGKVFTGHGKAFNVNEKTLKKGDVIKFKNGERMYILGPKGDGYDYKDGRQRGHHPKKWFDMMISTGKAMVEAKVNEEYQMINLKDILREGIEWQGILVKDATLKYNTKPTGGTPGVGLQFAGQSYVKAPKGTFLIGLPGGLFAVNMKKKFAMALTTGRRQWLDAQDKLKDGDVGGTNMAPEYSKWRHLLDH